MSSAKSKPSRSPARAALADAIDQHRLAIEDMDKRRSAASRARDILETAEARLATATADLEAARTAAEARIRAEAEGELAVVHKPDAASREARLRLEEARDDVEAARGMAETFEARLIFPNSFIGNPTDPVSLAVKVVRDAADRVIRDNLSIDERLARISALQAELIAVRGELVLAMGIGVDLVPEADRARVFNALLNVRLPRLEGTVGYDDVRTSGEMTLKGVPNLCNVEGLRSPWPAIRDALMSNPDAETF